MYKEAEFEITLNATGLNMKGRKWQSLIDHAVCHKYDIFMQSGFFFIEFIVLNLL